MLWSLLYIIRHIQYVIGWAFAQEHGPNLYNTIVLTKFLTITMQLHNGSKGKGSVQDQKRCLLVFFSHEHQSEVVQLGIYPKKTWNWSRKSWARGVVQGSILQMGVWRAMPLDTDSMSICLHKWIYKIIFGGVLDLPRALFVMVTCFIEGLRPPKFRRGNFCFFCFRLQALTFSCPLCFCLASQHSLTVWL